MRLDLSGLWAREASFAVAVEDARDRLVYELDLDNEEKINGRMVVHRVRDGYALSQFYEVSRVRFS